MKKNNLFKVPKKYKEDIIFLIENNKILDIEKLNMNIIKTKDIFDILLNDYSRNILYPEDNIIIFPFYYQDNLIVVSLDYNNESDYIDINFLNIILIDENMDINYVFKIKESSEESINLFEKKRNHNTTYWLF